MLEELKNSLTLTGYQFAHFAWSKAPTGDYGVYAEDSSTGVHANGHLVCQALQGTVDYFTRSDSETIRTTIQDALNSCNLAWYLNSIQYEEDTGYIHYEWVFEVP